MKNLSLFLSFWASVICIHAQRPLVSDDGFAQNGAWTLQEANCTGRDLLIQPDGKILVFGEKFTGSEGRILMVRLNPDGSLDPTFNSTGIVLGDVEFRYSLTVKEGALQSNGKILVAFNGYKTATGGRNSAVFARYNADGSLDTGFGDGGFLAHSSDSVTYGADKILVKDDKIFFMYYRSAMTSSADRTYCERYASDGQLDSSYGQNGSVVLPDSILLYNWALDAEVDAEGNLYLVGRTDFPHDVRLFKFNQQGHLDIITGLVHENKPSFNNYINYDLAITPENKLLIGASSIIQKPTLTRVTQNLEVDEDFGESGFFYQDTGLSFDRCDRIHVQPDGKLLLILGKKFKVGRLNSNGTYDLAFNDTGFFDGNNYPSNGFNQCFDVSSYGVNKFLMAGMVNENILIARYITTECSNE